MASVKFSIRQRKGKTAAIVLRFTIDRAHRFLLVTGEFIDPKYWDLKNQRVKGSHDEHLLLNQALDRIRVDVIQLYRDNRSKSIDELQDMARSLIKFGTTEVVEKKSLFPVLDQFIELWQRDKDEKTAQKFVSLKNKLLQFDASLELHRLDNNFYDRFKAWLFDYQDPRYKNQKRKGLVDTSVYKYITNISTFLTWADSRGHKIHYTGEKPTHKSWEIIKRVNEPITITLAELEKLESLTLTQDLIDEKLPPKKHGRREHTLQALTIARDYLVMESRTCQRISDLKSFDPRDMVGMVWHNKVTKGQRLLGKVTKVPFNTSFTAPAYAILQKYAMQLPEISESKLNKHIKTVCMLAGIDQEITVTHWKQNKPVKTTGPKYAFISTHTGRRTFITIGLQYMQPKVVKDLAGISWSTLKHYEGHSEDQVLIDGLNSIPSTSIMKAG